MNEFTLKIDAKTRDLIFDEDGMLEIVEGDDVYVQNVDNTLNTRLGEFFLDETHGTDFDRILDNNFSDVWDEAEEVVRDAILQEPQISLINTISVSVQANRALSVSFTGELASGETISMEELKLNE